MTKRIVIAGILWLVTLYTAHAAALAFNGEVASGGEPKGYAENISCTRNWWAFGLLWYCDATIIANDGKHYPYHSKNSVLMPDDIGERVPMTTNRVGSGMSQGSSEWGLAERVEPDKGLRMLGLIGLPVITLFITFRLFRNKKSVS